MLMKILQTVGKKQTGLEVKVQKHIDVMMVIIIMVIYINIIKIDIREKVYVEKLGVVRKDKI